VAQDEIPDAAGPVAMQVEIAQDEIPDAAGPVAPLGEVGRVCLPAFLEVPVAILAEVAQDEIPDAAGLVAPLGEVGRVCLPAFLEAPVAIPGEPAVVLMRAVAAAQASILDELAARAEIQQASMWAVPATSVAFPGEIAPGVSSVVPGLACRSQEAQRPEPVGSNLQDVLHSPVSLHSPVVHCLLDAHCSLDEHCLLDVHCLLDARHLQGVHRPRGENPAVAPPVLCALHSEDAYKRHWRVCPC